MKKLIVFLDTSILNFYYAEDSPNEMEATRAFFEILKSPNYEAITSTTAILEIERAEAGKKEKLLKIIKDYNIQVFEDKEEVLLLAKKYVDMEIIPKRFENDAIIISSATVNDADILLSWNFQHIVRMKTKKGVSAVNQLNGYKQIEIYKKREVIDSED